MEAFDLFDLVVLALATNGVVEVWHHGSIFADWREQVEGGLLGGFIAELAACPFCLSFWVGLALGGPWLVLASAESPWAAVPAGLSFVLAAIRGSHLIANAAKQFLYHPTYLTYVGEPIDEQTE